MNKVLLVFCVVVAVAFAAYTEEELSAWQQYKIDYGKAYGPQEDEMRLPIFVKNWRMIQEHNERYLRGEESWKMGLNQFTDKRSDELPLGFGVRGH